MARFELISQWQFAAPIDRVWDAIYAVENWPRWWKYVHHVEELRKGDDCGVGAVRRYTWSSRLPYSLTFAMRVTRVERPHLLEGEAFGELTGSGRWTLRAIPQGTCVRYDWNVAATRAWMNLLAPLLNPVYRWNHGEVMRAGARGLANHLRVSLLTS
jgi:Polyketide cyclase / dehydrase and lipid transport